MPSDGTESRVEALKRRRDQLNAKLVLERAKERRKSRAADTRRKILIGSYVLSRISSTAETDEGWTDAKWMVGMDKYLTRPADRALFGLPPRETPAQASEGTNTTSSQPSAADPQREADQQA